MNTLDFDWKPLALVPVLALVALPLVGSGSSWLTLTSSESYWFPYSSQ